MLPPFIIQRFQNLQNVNAQNMNLFYQGKDMEIFDYFPINPSICSGIGGTYNNFGQVGTTTVFNFLDGVFRFKDQVIPLAGSGIYQIPCAYNGTSVTITLGLSPGTQYVVAQLSFSTLDAFKVQTSATILPTTMTLAQIGSDPSYLILFSITVTPGPTYNVVVDGNCAWNYNGNQTILNYPSITNPNISNYSIVATKAGSPNVLTQIASTDSPTNPNYKRLQILNFTDSVNQYYSGLTMDVLNPSGNNYTELKTYYGTNTVYADFIQTSSAQDVNYMATGIYNRSYTSGSNIKEGSLVLDVSNLLNANPTATFQVKNTSGTGNYLNQITLNEGAAGPNSGISFRMGDGAGPSATDVTKISTAANPLLLKNDLPSISNPAITNLKITGPHPSNPTNRYVEFSEQISTNNANYMAAFLTNTNSFSGNFYAQLSLDVDSNGFNSTALTTYNGAQTNYAQIIQRRSVNNPAYLNMNIATSPLATAAATLQFDVSGMTSNPISIWQTQVTFGSTYLNQIILNASATTGISFRMGNGTGISPGDVTKTSTAANPLILFQDSGNALVGTAYRQDVPSGSLTFGGNGLVRFFAIPAISLTFGAPNPANTATYTLTFPVTLIVGVMAISNNTAAASVVQAVSWTSGATPVITIRSSVNGAPLVVNIFGWGFF